jgi:hypothetical protein
MRTILLSTVTMALIATSASQGFAAQSRHHVRKVAQATSEQLRDARNAVEQETQPAWPHAGWSAPAGR